MPAQERDTYKKATRDFSVTTETAAVDPGRPAEHVASSGEDAVYELQRQFNELHAQRQDHWDEATKRLAEIQEMLFILRDQAQDAIEKMGDV